MEYSSTQDVFFLLTRSTSQPLWRKSWKIYTIQHSAFLFLQNFLHWPTPSSTKLTGTINPSNTPASKQLCVTPWRRHSSSKVEMWRSKLKRHATSVVTSRKGKSKLQWENFRHAAQRLPQPSTTLKLTSLGHLWRTHLITNEERSRFGWRYSAAWRPRQSRSKSWTTTVPQRFSCRSLVSHVTMDTRRRCSSTVAVRSLRAVKMQPSTSKICNTVFTLILQSTSSCAQLEVTTFTERLRDRFVRFALHSTSHSTVNDFPSYNGKPSHPRSQIQFSL